MKKLLRSAIVAALALLAGSPLAAQGIAGNWITEFDRQIRNDGGAVSTGERARARITLTQKGDSVTGTWQVISDPANTSRPRAITGTVAGNKVSLQAQFQATINRNGETEERTITILYDLTMAGDKLEGTMSNRSGDMETPARPFTAVREK